MCLRPARQAKNRTQMHTEESILTEMRRLGFILTPLENVGYHFEYHLHNLFLCQDRKRNNVLKIVRPISTETDITDNILISNLINEVNNVMDLTTVTTVDNETIWVSYRSYIFGSEPLEELLKMAISAVAGTSEYILDRLQMYKII